MTQSQTFSIVPSGVIRGGAAQYTADLDTGAISYSAQVNLPLWQNKKAAGTYDVDPAVLKSSLLNLPGDKTTIGGVTFEVVSVVSGQANVSVSNPSFSGTAVLDVSGEYLKVIKATAVVSGINVVLNAEV